MRNSSKQLPSKYRQMKLTINTIQLMNQLPSTLTSFLSFSINNTSGVLIKQSPIMNKKDINKQVWIVEISVDKYQNNQSQKQKNKIGCQVQFVIYAELGNNKGRKNFVRQRQVLCQGILSQGKNVSYLFDKKNQNVMACIVNYSIEEQNKIRKKNHFQQVSNIFQDYQLQQQPLKKSNTKNTALPKSNSKPKQKSKPSSYKKTNFSSPILDIIQDSEEQNSDTIQAIFEQKEQSRLVLQKVSQVSLKLQQSIKKSQDQKIMFSKYLDESTNFIHYLMSEMQSKKLFEEKINQISQIKQQNNQVQQEITTQQRWYTKKYNANQIKIGKKYKKFFIQKSPKLLTSENKVNITYYHPPISQTNPLKKQIAHIHINTEQNPKQITVYIQRKLSQQNKIKNNSSNNLNLITYCSLVKQNGKSSNQWPTLIQTYYEYTVYIKCQTDSGDIYWGCIGKEEQKFGYCNLFSEKGDQKGIMQFKFKEVSQNLVQTYDILEENLLQKQQNKNKKRQKANKKQTKERSTSPIHIISNNEKQYDLLNPRKSQQTNLVKSFVYNNNKLDQFQISNKKQINFVLNDSENPKVEIEKMQLQKKSQDYQKIPIFWKFQKSQNTANHGIQSHNLNSPIKNIDTQNIQKTNIYKKKLQFHLNNSLNNKVPKVIQNFGIFKTNNTIQQQSTTSKSNRINQNYSHLLQRAKTEVQQNSQGKMEFRPQKYKPTKSQFQSQKTENSIKLHLQNLKHINQQQIISQGLNERQAANISLPTQKRSNLRILQLKAKLLKPSFKGKFLKISINNGSSPYFTQANNQLYSLHWKGKGYFFLNISLFSILTFQLFQVDNVENNNIGYCKIHLSLLSKQDNYVQGWLKNKDQEVIGIFIMHYELSRKRLSNFKISLSREKKKAQQYLQKDNKKQTNLNKLYKSQAIQPNQLICVNTQKKSSEKSPRNKSRLSKNTEQIQNVFKKLQQSNVHSDLKKRKYYGGNIIIPKAERFKIKPKQLETVGPGTYQYQSQFHRHAIKL